MRPLSDFFDEYRTGYHYPGKPGTGIAIDCSHLVTEILNKAGHSIEYASTGAMEASGNYDRIPLADAQPDDILVYIKHDGKNNHTGILVSYDPATGNGVFFGSQSKGPANANFGPDTKPWKAPTYVLRPKSSAPKAPAPTPALPPVKTTSLNWRYPARPQGGVNGAASAVYFFGLARALGGHYPLGGNGLCHPGVHFDLGSASAGRTKDVFAMADGEVIAYRIDKSPLATRYPNNLSVFDSSFVLIRHKLEMPPIPKPPAPVEAAAPTAETPVPLDPAAPQSPAPVQNTSAVESPSVAESSPDSTGTEIDKPLVAEPPVEEPPVEEPPPSITLYSLYMHLASWQTYEKDKTIPKPPYINTSYIVKAELTDSLRGMRLRNKPGGEEIAIIPKGCQLVLTGQLSTDKRYAKVASISPASAISGWTPGAEAWIFVSDLDANFSVGAKANDVSKLKPPPVKTLYVYKDKNKKNVIACLPAGAELTLGEQSDKDSDLYKIVGINSLQGYPELPKNGENIEGWVEFSKLAVKPYAPPAGVQLLAEKPYPIAAGQYLGQFGIYQNHNQYIPQQQIHIEMFASEDLKSFIDKCREKADKLDDRHKTIVKIPKGTLLAPQLYIMVMSNKNPPQSGVGTPIQTDLYFSMNSLDDLKSTDRITATIPANKKTKAAAKTLNWYRLNNIATTESGDVMDGWVSNESFEMVNPWSFPGFECIEDDAQPADLLAYQLSVANKIRGAEAEKHKDKIQKGASSALITTLLGALKKYKIRDLNVADTLSSKLFSEGLKKFWYAQQTASLAIKTQTQWKKDLSLYSNLGPLLKMDENSPNPVWDKEQERMRNLAFWEDVSGVTGGADGNLWFVNPIQLIDNFNAKKFRWARTVFGEAIAKVESRGSYIIYNRGASHNYEIIRDVNICAYTLARMQQEGINRNIFAAGKFQIIPDTLNEAIEKLKLNTNLLFDEEMQDYIFDEYLIKIKRPAIIRYLEGGGDVEDAMYAWAQEWASGGIRKGKKMSRRAKEANGKKVKDENGEVVFHEPPAAVEGVSYYGGDGINKAHILPNEMKEALEKAKASR